MHAVSSQGNRRGSKGRKGTLRSRITTELCAGRLAEADHGQFIHDDYLLAYQVPLAARAQQRFVGRQAAHPNFNFFFSSAQSRRYRLIKF